MRAFILKISRRNFRCRPVSGDFDRRSTTPAWQPQRTESWRPHGGAAAKKHTCTEAGSPVLSVLMMFTAD